MRIRRIAVLIDGGFFLKRLPKLLEPRSCTTPKQVAEVARHLCMRHVQRLAHLEGTEDTDLWLDHVYRLFYYDAVPYDGVVHHPVLNRPIDFQKSDVAVFRRGLFAELRDERKFALRLGHVAKGNGWRLSTRVTRQVLKIGKWLQQIEAEYMRAQAPGHAPPAEEFRLRELQNLIAAWQQISESDVSFELRQKGVDMRIGLDIASMTLKHQADTIVLVTGDSDFVPAAKLARREGVEFLLDPLGQHVSDELSEHVDGIVSVFPEPPLDQVLIAAA